MKKTVFLSVCAALFLSGCECVDCGKSTFSVNPEALFMNFTIEEGVEESSVGEYTSSKGRITVSSSHSWTAIHPTLHVILSQYQGRGGQSLVTVTFTQKFMKEFDESHFYQDGPNGFLIETIRFVSEDGKEGNVSVYYKAGLFMESTADAIVMTDVPRKYSADETTLLPNPKKSVEVSLAPEAYPYDPETKRGFGTMNFIKGVNLKVFGAVRPEVEGVFELNEAFVSSMSTFLQGRLNGTVVSYAELVNYGIGYESFNAYLQACMAALCSEDFFRVSGLDTSLPFNGGLEYDLSFDFGDAFMPYPYWWSYGHGGDLELTIHELRLIDIIRELWTPNMILGTYTISVEEGGWNSSTSYNVTLDGHLRVLDTEGVISAMSNLESAEAVASMPEQIASLYQDVPKTISLTPENFYPNLYICNSFAGDIQIDFKEFRLMISGQEYTLTAHSFIDQAGHPLSWYNIGAWFNLMFYYPGEGELQDGSPISWENLSLWKDIKLYGGHLPYTPQLHKLHMVCLHESFLLDLVKLMVPPNAPEVQNAPATKYIPPSISWELGQTLGLITYTDVAGNSQEIEVVLNISAAELYSLYYTMP